MEGQALLIVGISGARGQEYVHEWGKARVTEAIPNEELDEETNVFGKPGDTWLNVEGHINRFSTDETMRISQGLWASEVFNAMPGVEDLSGSIYAFVKS